MKKRIVAVLPLLITFAVIFIFQLYFEQSGSDTATSTSTATATKPDQQPQVNHSPAINNPQLWAAYQDQVAKLQVRGQGIIIKVLKDDLEGSRHQRLLLQVNDKQTLLIAHNIDLAPRIANPEVGAVVEFYGEYVWNNKGGVLHWTHRDPRGNHPNGWLQYQGKRYQ